MQNKEIQSGMTTQKIYKLCGMLVEDYGNDLFRREWEATKGGDFDRLCEIVKLREAVLLILEDLEKAV